ncbi:WD40 repeat domain-containing protein [bacterium]|nr:MAG: WD40 repeat domain-containing protein [bacterium]
MKIKFLLAVAVLAALLTPHPSQADVKPQLFGVQQDAYIPWLSWKGKLLAVINENTNRFQIWDVATRRSLWKSDDFLLAVSRDEKTVMVAHAAQPIAEEELSDINGVSFLLLDARTGHQLKRIPPVISTNQSNEVDELLEYGFLDDGNDFILATQDYLRVYNARSGALRIAKKWSGLKADVPLTCATLTYDKKHIVAFDGDFVVLDAHSGALVRRMKHMKPSVTSEEVWEEGPDMLEVSPDNYLLVEKFAASNNSRVYRLSDGKLLWSTSDWPTFSWDGKLAYVPTELGLEIHDAHTGRKLNRLAGPKEYGFEPSPDGNWFYEARDNKIYRWRAR